MFKRLLNVLAVLLFCSTAMGTDVHFTLSDFGANPPDSRVVTWQRLQPFPSNLFTNISDDAGTFTIAGASVADYAVTIRASGGSGAISFQVTVTATNLGTVEASTITSQLGIQTYPTAGKASWTISSADQRYQLSGTTLSNTFYPLFSNPSNYISTATLQATNTALTSLVSATSNGLFSVATNISTNQVFLATNGFSSIVYSNGAVFVNTNLLFVTSNALAGQIGSVGISATTATNISTNQVFLGTNGMTGLVRTNPLQVLYTNSLPGLTNGFVDKSITNNAATIAYAQSLTNGFVDKSITNNAATIAYAQSLTNGFVDKSITNNAATIAYAQSLTNGVNSAAFRRTNEFVVTESATFSGGDFPMFHLGSNSVADSGYGTNSFPLRSQTIGQIQAGTNISGLTTSVLNNGTTSVKIDGMSSVQWKALYDGNVSALSTDNGLGSNLELDTNATSGNVALTVVGNQFNTGNLDVTGNSFFRGPVVVTNGAIFGNGIGLTNTSATNITGNALTQVTNIAQFSIGVLSINAVTGTNIATALIGLSNAPIVATNLALAANKLNRTNDTAYGLVATNTAFLGDISFGHDGLSTNIISRTNFIAFINAGSGPATNGALIWAGTQNVYTNWLNGAILTNNGSAWLLQTNGVTLYSLSGASPVGTYSAIGGSLPAPLAVYTAALNEHMVMLGYWSVSNQNSILATLQTNIVTIASNNAIANLSGLGTNTTLVFSNAIWGIYPTIIGSLPYGSSMLSGVSNTLFNGTFSVIGGGLENEVGATGQAYDAILGGRGNTVTESAGGFIGGGEGNSILGGTDNSIPGGLNNVASTNSVATANYSFVSGGAYNLLDGSNGVSYSGVVGGLSNIVHGSFSLAGGHNVTISTNNVFAWSDGTPVTASTPAQLQVTATNGIYLNGPLWLNALSTNGGVYILSNRFSLFAVTNNMPNFAHWFGNSNGISVDIYYSNGVPVMKNNWP